MTQEQLISVFEDTIAQVESGHIVSKAYTLPEDIHNIDPVVSKTESSGTKTVISVVNLDSVTAAMMFNTLGGKTAILNMASPTRPGGGVANGAKAQEECLFRCSDLFRAITLGFYPLGESDGLYTVDATFFKGFNYEPIEPFHADVITVAALNLNAGHHSESSYSESHPDYEAKTRNKIKLIYELARINGVDNLILGAWGCGVYQNNPTLIAKWFLEGYLPFEGFFRHVQFAVINDHNSVANNYSIFLDAVNTFGQPA